MKKLFCVIISLLFGIAYLQAQTYTLKGVVIDNQTKEPLFYASVGLLKAEDSTSVVGVDSDGNGKFEILNVKQGNYLFQASYVGYEMYRVPFSVEGESKIIQMDTIRLMPNIILATFTVEDKRPVYMTDGEKDLYNVSEDPSIQTGTAADALQNAPGVEVDIEGNITLRGVSSVQIWINDKPSKLEAENLKTYIQQLPANSLERIEVITNPSARYSSEGTGGIINLITKSNIKKNNFISFGVNGSSRPMLSPWISYMWANEKFSINIYAYSHLYKNKSNSHGYNITYDNNFDTSAYRNLTTTSNDFSFSGGLYTNGSYMFDSMNTLSFYARVNTSFSDNHSFSEQYQKEYLTDIGEYSFTNKQTINRGNTNGRVGLSYQHKFNNKGHNLSVDIDGGFEKKKWGGQLDRIYDGKNDKDIHYKDPGKRSEYNMEMSADYSIPYHKNGEISVGTVGSYTHWWTYIRTDTLLPNTVDVYNLDSLRFEDSYYKSGIWSGYFTIQHKFGNFTMKAGLRTVYRNYNYEIINSPKDDVKKGYWGFYPSLHLSYRTKSMHNFTLSYTRRVNYPQWHQLSTFIEYSTDSYSTGNPDLLPTYTNSVDAGWTKYFDKFGSVGLSAYYRNSKDEINNLTDVSYLDYYGRIVPFSMPVNSGHSYQYGASTNVMYRLKAFMNIRLNASVYHSYSETLFRKDKEPTKTPNTAYSFRLSFWAKLWKLLEVHASGNYRSKTKSLFNENKPTYSVNCGLRADFWKRKISVHINVQDIFNWNKQENNTTNPYYESYSSVKHNSRFISAGITFRFGKIEMENQARTGGEME